ncbi:hypothetical protein EYF80_060690 [Liparis tanakae]|uniref:Uncharacterized protein n=1 Tax=Liparis tanakae TaxID=230148 RepID=A0A4Z2ELC2_9TELE|nr:hypothetical protein EYF80_060690 [Liparis tanakae]
MRILLSGGKQPAVTTATGLLLRWSSQHPMKEQIKALRDKALSTDIAMPKAVPLKPLKWDRVNVSCHAHRSIHSCDSGGLDVFGGRALCLDHHAALRSQSDDDRPTAAPQQLPAGVMRLLHVSDGGTSQQLRLCGDVRDTWMLATFRHARSSGVDIKGNSPRCEPLHRRM